MKNAPRREIFAWMTYDFANSAYAIIVLTAVFPIFFTDTLVGDRTRGLAIWGYVYAASMACVVILAPLLGAITDSSANKKKYLFVMWIVASCATGSLGFFGPGQWKAAALCFITANIGFAAGNALYNAFLPELVRSEDADRVSGIGWGFGYLAGGLSMCLVIWVVEPQQWELLMVGAWWLVFGIPFFVLVRERAKPVPITGNKIQYGIRKVVRTLVTIRKFPQLSKYLLAFLLYTNGVETVIIMAAGFGKAVLNMSDNDLLMCLLLIQGVALVGSLLFGWLAHKIGSRNALLLALVIWVGVLLWGSMIQSRTEFWILGALVGTVLGGTQAISRSMMAKFTPTKYTGEFFGIFAIGGKFSAVIGPIVFSVVTQFTENVRFGILSLLVFCILGFASLWVVNEEKGKKEALAA